MQACQQISSALAHTCFHELYTWSAARCGLPVGRPAAGACWPAEEEHVCRDDKDIDPFRWGTLVGSAMGGMSAFTGGCTSILTSYRKMNPFCIPFSITNMGSAMLAMDTGLMGPNYSISTACATGNYCMMNAYNHIQAGDADLMLAGATDAAIIPTGIGGFIACKAPVSYTHLTLPTKA